MVESDKESNLGSVTIFNCSPDYFEPPYKEELLVRMIRRILKYCMDNGIESIAIPPIGIGNLNIPVNISADCISSGIRKFYIRFLEKNNLNWENKRNYQTIENFPSTISKILR